MYVWICRKLGKGQHFCIIFSPFWFWHNDCFWLRLSRMWNYCLWTCLVYIKKCVAKSSDKNKLWSAEEKFVDYYCFLPFLWESQSVFSILICILAGVFFQKVCFCLDLLNSVCEIIRVFVVCIIAFFDWN